ncbi:MAG: hypothetical protein COV07_03655 [Candidatus Vogelbacteria bacterium CG10_big_fil_rev_8_21_14_0_10_45_14]|uniref:Uncharacterized protein n=1 Tax=Candidatus Vogelbacteria bacterium CG10_big_fil_rev_8_21_14_0_10_45_14 TaxID=1975042 RepID=A0A2H0RL92_9BACT|nr:MAG: hypothetical protein COV07_03655 [Candidatus Vogelbacteria bacterium CG10_big_fil_rev_8_21_14_0_10_45_14]
MDEETQENEEDEKPRKPKFGVFSLSAMLFVAGCFDAIEAVLPVTGIGLAVSWMVTILAWILLWFWLSRLGQAPGPLFHILGAAQSVPLLGSLLAWLPMWVGAVLLMYARSKSSTLDKGLSLASTAGKAKDLVRVHKDFGRAFGLTPKRSTTFGGKAGAVAKGSKPAKSFGQVPTMTNAGKPHSKSEQKRMAKFMARKKSRSGKARASSFGPAPTPITSATGTGAGSNNLQRNLKMRKEREDKVRSLSRRRFASGAAKHFGTEALEAGSEWTQSKIEPKKDQEQNEWERRKAA